MTDVTDLLAEWRKLADEASSGPWDYYRPHPRYRSYVIESVTPAGHLSDDGVVMVCEDVNAEDNAAFVAASRTAVPALLDAVQAVRTLHQPDPRPTCQCRECSLTDLSHDECAACHIPWPCPTVRAINDALTTGDTND